MKIVITILQNLLTIFRVNAENSGKCINFVENRSVSALSNEHLVPAY